MDYWLIDVVKEVSDKKETDEMSYLNTYFSEAEAIKEARLLTFDPTVIQVGVHHWIFNVSAMKRSGRDRHANDGENGYKNCIPFYYNREGET